MSKDELRKKLCVAVNIFPEELVHDLPNSIGVRQMEALEAVVNLEVIAVLDRLTRVGSIQYDLEELLSTIEIEKGKYSND